MKYLPVLLVLFLAGVADASPDRRFNGRWSADSTTAMGITGDIVLSDGGIRFENGREITFEYVETQVKEGTEDSWLIEPGEPYDLFRITSTENPILLRGNRLCGDVAPTFMITLRRQAPMQGALHLRLAFFYTKEKPSSGSFGETCGSFSYGARSPN